MKLLIVTEDKQLMSSLVSAFVHKHYLIEQCSSYDELFHFLSFCYVDAVILDCGHQKKDSLELIQNIRSQKVDLPLLVLTKDKSVSFRIDLFEAGADDLIEVPFSIHELFIRVKKILRRVNLCCAEKMNYHGLVVSAETRMLFYQGKSMALTATEYQLIERMMINPERVISREHLMSYVWGIDAQVESGALWTHISNLRRKIRMLDVPVEIISIKSFGYVLKCKT